MTRTPCSWMPRDASDECQLLRATARGRALFTFNIRDFSRLATEYPRHGGIVFAAQASWNFSALIAALDLLLRSTSAHALAEHVVWLKRSQ